MVRESSCYGYSLALPPDWTVESVFNAGYQQGENAILLSSNGRDKIEIGVFYTPIDYLKLTEGVSLGQSEYLLAGPEGTVRDGAQGKVTYLRVVGELNGVVLSYLYSPRQDWYVTVGVWRTRLYDSASAAAARAVIDSLAFR